MERILRARSESYSRPQFSFPGDENISALDYAEAIDSGYISSVSTIVGAAEGFGLKVDDETFERWKRTASAVGLVDSLLDNPRYNDDIFDLYPYVIRGLTHDSCSYDLPRYTDVRLKTILLLLGNSLKSLPSSSVEKMVDSTFMIGEIAKEKAKCSDVGRYIEILKREAYLTARIITSTASDYVRTQASFVDFKQWSQDAMELGTLIDSAKDLKDDLAEGRCNVALTAKNSLAIALSAKRA